MEIKTKFNIGQTGFILDHGIIKEVRVNEIKISVYEDGQFKTTEISIDYILDAEDNSIIEDFIFKTKEELFESIPVKSIND